MIHTLKTWPIFFQAVWDGKKKFEYRRDDRGFSEGDYLDLLEWNPDTEKYSGRMIFASIGYKIKGFNIPSEYCILGIEVLLKGTAGPLYKPSHKGLELDLAFRAFLEKVWL